MKLKILWIALLIIVFSFPSLCLSEQPNPKVWKPLEYNSYYNIKIITTAADTKLVWTYKTVTNDTRENRIEEVKKYDLGKSIRYQNYSHEVVLWEIDCKKRLRRVKDIIDFGKDEKVLDRYRYGNSEWDSIIPVSRGELLYQEVCVTKMKPLKKKSLKKKYLKKK
jgi:hypothetical protein